MAERKLTDLDSARAELAKEWAWRIAGRRPRLIALSTNELEELVSTLAVAAGRAAIAELNGQTGGE